MLAPTAATVLPAVAGAWALKADAIVPLSGRVFDDPVPAGSASSSSSTGWRSTTASARRSAMSGTGRLIDDPACRDAGLIASLQRVAHFGIAVRGTLGTWAAEPGLEDDATKAADAMLADLATRGINPEATWRWRAAGAFPRRPGGDCPEPDRPAHLRRDP
jgi:hypothetical protein